MANEGQGARAIDPTLKLTNERLREVFAWLSGYRICATTLPGGEVAQGVITEPTPDELASIANDLLSTRTALAITNETCTQLEAELEAAELTQRSCA